MSEDQAFWFWLFSVALGYAIGFGTGSQFGYGNALKKVIRDMQEDRRDRQNP